MLKDAVSLRKDIEKFLTGLGVLRFFA